MFVVLMSLLLHHDQAKCDSELVTRVVQNAMIMLQSKVWRDKNIPYGVNSGVNQPGTYALYRSMELIEMNTCIRFVERSVSDPHYITFAMGEPSHSQIGLNKNERSHEVHIYEGHENESFIIHELFHVLGRQHEHSRRDRDRFVRIMWNNILPGYKQAFEKHRSFISQGIPYDYGSIMHFKAFAFTKNGRETINPLVSGVATESLGGAPLPTLWDYLHINLLYCQATSLMTRHLSLHPSSVFVRIKWTAVLPSILPTFYHAQFKCSLMCAMKRHYRYSLVKVLNAETRSAVIREFSPASKCRLKLIAVYNPASLDSGTRYNFTTLSEKPSSYPPGLQSTDVQPHSITLVWDQVPCQHQNGHMLGYRLKVYAPSKEDPAKHQRRSYFLHSEHYTTYTVTSLEPATEYKFKINAFNEEGEGVWSPALEVKSAGETSCTRQVRKRSRKNRFKPYT